MKNTIASLATGSALCGALLLSGATSAQAARPDDRGPQASVTATVALHNSTAEIGADCPDSTNNWWHFVVAPNNDRYSIDEMTLNLGTSTLVATGDDIVGNGHQVDNVFVKVPSTSSLDALIAAGSSAEVTGPDSRARLMLSHLCVGSDNDVADEEIIEDEITDDEITNDTDDEITNDDTTNDDTTNDDITDDVTTDEETVDDEITDDEIVNDIDDDTSDDDSVNDDITEEEIVNDDEDTDDDVAEDQPADDTTDDIVATELPATDAPVIDNTPVTETPADETPVDDAPAPIVPAEVTADAPTPEMPMLQPATTVASAVAQADTTIKAPAPVTDQADAPASNPVNTGSLPTTGASLLLTPALILIGAGAAVRRAAARRR